MSCMLLSCVWVTIDGALDWILDLLTTYTHNLLVQIITAQSLISTTHKSPQHLLSLLPACVFTSHSLATASNSGDFSVSCAKVLSSLTRVQNSLGSPNWVQDNSSAQTTQKHSISSSTSIVARQFVAAGTRIPSRCLETSLVYSPISRSSHSNSSTCYITQVNRLVWTNYNGVGRRGLP
jgi:hypothetical protein